MRVLNMRDLGKDLCDRDLQPPIRSLMVYGANPMVSMPNQNRIRQGLMRDDLFTVVHDLFVTETARYADYVLPATSQIEHLDLSPAWGHLYLAMNRPAIAPRGESVSNTELFRRLAAALGRTGGVAVRERRVHAARRAGERTSVARWHHVRTSLGRGPRPHELCRDDWRPFANGGFQHAERQGRTVFGVTARGRARSAAVGRSRCLRAMGCS